jgi:ATP-dependent DNA helicase RecQ
MSETSSPLSILNSVFGFREFRGLQREAIDHVLAGGDGLVLMPTGGGKSLCYQIPSILRPGTGIIVSPLIALMQDQVQGLRQMGVRAACLNSSLSWEEARHIEEALPQGGLDILYVAPERLLQSRFQDLLSRTRIGLFAIDEAHCVSQWGHDFRPEYTQLTVLKEQFPGVPRLALTATADTPTRADIIRNLNLESARTFATGFDRPNIRYTVVPKQNAHSQLQRFIRDNHLGESGIVYRLSRKKVEQTAQWLQDQGIPALPYHAGIPSHLRAANQDRFMNEEGIVMVATIAFGMGVDKPNIRFVAHLEPPKSMEAYYQETGRAGRDGLPADAWLTYGFGDVTLLRTMIKNSEAEERQKRVEWMKLDALLGFLEISTCRRQALLRYFGDDPGPECNNCDTCLHPVQTWDGTIAAQKALSNIFRTGARFGVGHLTDVLTGSETPTVLRWHHNHVSTFGIGTELNKKGWTSVYRQLSAMGALNVDVDSYGALKLNHKSWAIMKGQVKCMLRHDPAPISRSKTKRSSRSSTMPATEEGRTLWEALRSARLKTAEAQGVPPYAIFSDRTLLELVEFRPETLEQLPAIHGIGARKQEQYGPMIMTVLQSHTENYGRPDTIQELPDSLPATPPPSEPKELSDTAALSLGLFRKKGSVALVAEARGLKESTIYTHLEQAVELGLVDGFEVTGLPMEDLKKIETVLADFEAKAIFALKPIFEALQEKYSYAALRCVRAERKKRNR